MLASATAELVAANFSLASVVQVHTSTHFKFKVQFIQKKMNKFTFIVHQFSLELVHVQFINSFFRNQKKLWE